MDSLTQIVLGAAVGEAVAGKKIGNRAMLWGAIAGTIPDLDVISSAWLDDLGRIVAHRGLSHSLLFAVVFPFLMAWLVKRLYDSALYKKRWYKWLVTGVNILFIGAILLGINWIFYQSEQQVQPLVLAISVLAAAAFVYWILRFYLQDPLPQVQADYKTWYWLFFWAILTHPILDAFTTYGTQLFLPFSNARVAFNNIAVVDPFYTVPFAICLIAALCLGRQSRSRRIWNWAGIGISSAYMLLTLIQKNDVDQRMEAALQKQGISYTQTFSSPTLFNNRLWHCVVMTAGDTCYQAFYSRRDTRPEWVFHPLPRHQELIAGHENDEALHILRWFSKGLDAVRREPDGSLSWLDLRFGGVSPDDADLPEWVFGFDLKLTDKQMRASEKEPKMDRVGDSWRQFMRRQRGL